MRGWRWVVSVLLTTAAAGAAGAHGQSTEGADRLYGRVSTAGGRVYEGFLRWDKNEGGWSDLLNGSRETAWENRRDAERLDDRGDRGRERGRLEIFGVRISWDRRDDDVPPSSTSGIRFGHLRSLVVSGDDRAYLTLKSGGEVEFEGGSTDIGDGFRGLVVEDPDHGEVSLRWRDLDAIDFLPSPRGAQAPGARRLFGTVTTRDGLVFTGYVAWDMDEILTTDVLDGREDGRDREIPFGRIAAIERQGSSGARVVLRDGDALVLRGSNDVNDGNRGISVSDPELGQATISWEDFEAVSFHPDRGTASRYDDFDGGHPLRGTVWTDDGERLEGYVRWDNDEAWSWEILDGRAGDVDLDVEFGQLRSIRRMGSWGSEVTLLDGRTFELEGSNDVADGNKGIYLTLDDGETVLVPWRDFREVVFSLR
jgi:hypothetical protein